MKLISWIFRSVYITYIKWPIVFKLFRFLILSTESGGRRLSFSPLLMSLGITVLKLNHDASSFSVSTCAVGQC